MVLFVKETSGRTAIEGGLNRGWQSAESHTSHELHSKLLASYTKWAKRTRNQRSTPSPKAKLIKLLATRTVGAIYPSFYAFLELAIVFILLIRLFQRYSAPGRCEKHSEGLRQNIKY